MKNILLVSAFGTIDSKSNSRLANIYSYLSTKNNVKLVSTNFDHSQKAIKPKSNKLPNEIWLNVTSYKNNISVFRLLSHIVFAARLSKFLHMSPKPDLIYCTMPTTLAAFFCGRYCKINGIPFVIDVIDLWPESLYPASNISKLLPLICFPWSYFAHKAYGYANLLCAESEYYLSIASQYNTTAKKDFFYLGVDQARAKQLLATSKIFLSKPANEIWVCYGGQLGNSYDFDVILEAIKFIHDNGVKYRFLFIGDGELRPKIEQTICEFGLNAMVTGFVAYEDFLKYLSYCDIAINAFKENTRVVHSYKFNDYVSMNTFILNNLPGETSGMVDDYNIGLNFNYSTQRLPHILLGTCQNWPFYKNWKENCKKLIAEKLDKHIIYSKMAMHINGLLKL